MAKVEYCISTTVSWKREDVSMIFIRWPNIMRKMKLNIPAENSYTCILAKFYRTRVPNLEELGYM